MQTISCIRILILVCVCWVSSVQGSFAQLFPNGDFEQGTEQDCDCADYYFCVQDAGRVIDGIHPLYQPGDHGCALEGVAYTLSLGAHSGTGYIYFYAGGDQVISPDTLLNNDYKIELSVWYAGPQGAGGVNQNGPGCYFTFGLDGDRIGPQIPVPVNTPWTKHTLEWLVTPGMHNFSIMSGASAKYSIWFDDFEVEILCEYPDVDLGADTILCSGETLLLDASYPNATYLWQDNSTMPTYLVDQEGSYWVEVTDNCGTTTDTIYVGYDQLASIELGNDTTLCSGETLHLDVGMPGATYLWNDGTTNAQLTISQPGVYWVRVDNQCGSVRDTITVDYTFIPVADLGNDTVLCLGEYLILQAGNPGAQCLWQDNTNSSSYTVNTSGIYWVEVSNDCGISIDSIRVDYIEPPQVDLGPDQHLCDGEVLMLNASSPYSSYNWQDGSADSAFSVSEQGLYWVEISNKCGVDKDSVYVAYDLTPEVNLGNDTILCSGDTLHLNVYYSGASYLWQNGSTNSSIKVAEPGSYWVKVSFNDCLNTDSVNVYFDEIPYFTYGSDTSLCKDEELILDFSSVDASCVWQDGSTDPIYSIMEGGTYSANFKNACGEFIFSIDVLFSDCNCKLYLPSSFSPNMDGKNDYFAPVYSCEIMSYKLFVFDRWGNVVFYTEDINDKWDGTSQGNKVSSGIYTYVLSYSTSGDEIMEETGSVMIIR